MSTKLIKVTAYQKTDRFFLLEDESLVQDKITEWNNELPIKDVQTKELGDCNFLPDEPYIGIEWSAYYHGGEWDDNHRYSETAYVPKQLCEKLGNRTAFTVFTGINPVHIISEDIGELFNSEGDEYKENSEYTGEIDAEVK
jgi:hypothetical protein